MQLRVPSPLSSFLSSLVVLVVLAVLYVIGARLLRRDPERKGFFARLIGFLHRLDEYLVKIGKWIVGTGWSTVWVRRLAVASFFGGIALGGVFSPFPWCLWIVCIGLFGVFLVFRHWSHIEDDVMLEHHKVRQVNLNAEMFGACACVFVYAPVAFAQIQSAGIGFNSIHGAPPYVFVSYTIVELFKVGAIVQYSDTFADYLPFLKLPELSSPSLQTKIALLVFRGTLDLIILTVIKRLLDIARRVAEGLDLRPIKETIASGTTQERLAAVEQLERFSLRNREHPGGRELHAKQLLEDIVHGKTRPKLPVEVRFAAANSMLRFGERREDRSALLVATHGYDAIAQNEWNLEATPRQWATVQERLGNAYQAIGKLETYRDRLRKAAACYRRALRIYKIQRMDREGAAIQTRLAETLRLLSDRETPDRLRKLLEEAIRVYQEAGNVYEREHMTNESLAVKNDIIDITAMLEQRTATPPAETVAA
jgi:tetratricopeptide (TPR) repeat protein